MTAKGIVLAVLLVSAAAGAALYLLPGAPRAAHPRHKKALAYQPCKPLDTRGFLLAAMRIKPWKDLPSLEDIRRAFSRLGPRNTRAIDAELARRLDPGADVRQGLVKTSLVSYEGRAAAACAVLRDTPGGGFHGKLVTMPSGG
jgi:hypothetical protein